MPQIKPNARVVASAIAGPRMSYTVEGHSGLGLAVRGDGTGSWTLRYRINGNQREHTLTNDAKHATISDVLRAKDEWLSRVKLEKIDPKAQLAAEAKAALVCGLTLDALFADWLERHSKLKKRTWRHDEIIYRAHVAKRLGNKQASEISRKEIIHTLGEISSEVGGLSVNRVHTLISSMYTWAVSMEIVAIHPAMKIPKFAVETTRERVWSHDELRKLWAALGRIIDVATSGPITPTLAMAIKALLLTGQRRGEVAQAQVQEVIDDIWSIPASRMKAGTAQSVPLAPMAATVFADAIARGAPSQFVFPGKSGMALDPHSITRALNRLNKALCISNATVHDLRRTVASEMARIGIAESVISRVLAHTQSGITARVYNRHSYDAEKRDALQRWEAELLRIATLPALAIKT